MQCACLSHSRLLEPIAELAWAHGLSLGIYHFVFHKYLNFLAVQLNTPLQLRAINTQALRRRRWFLCQRERPSALRGMWARLRTVINNPYQSHLSVSWCAVNCSSRDAYNLLTQAISKRPERGSLCPAETQRWSILPLDICRLFFHWDNQVEGKGQAEPRTCGHYLVREAECGVREGGRSCTALNHTQRWMFATC